MARAGSHQNTIYASAVASSKAKASGSDYNYEPTYAKQRQHSPTSKRK
jgi:hypothetical protein